MTQHNADSILTDQERDEQRDSIRNELDAIPPSGVNASDPDARGAEATATTPGDRSLEASVTGGFAQPLLDNLRSAVSSARAAKATMEEVERHRALPSGAFVRVEYGVRAFESALSDVDKGNWP